VEGGRPTRPTGISVIAILAAISGVFAVVGGLAFFGMGMVGGAMGLMAGRPGLALLGPLGAFGGVLILALGVVYLYTAYGAWTLQPWAWTWMLAISIVGFALAVVNLRGSVLSLFINGVIIYYLYTPAVKSAFGRS
jgi:hypothetical protein